MVRAPGCVAVFMLRGPPAAQSVVQTHVLWPAAVTIIAFNGENSIFWIFHLSSSTSCHVDFLQLSKAFFSSLNIVLQAVSKPV